MTRMLTIAHTVWLDLLRRKDLYVLLILAAALLAALVALDIFGLGGMVRYVKDVGLLLAWIFSWILAVHVASRELPREEASGTIFPLLARPVRRHELLLGKWLGAWSIAACATLLFYLLVVAVVAAKGGGMNFAALIQGAILHGALLGILSATALAFSTRLNHDAAATLTFVMSGATFLIVPRVPALLLHAKGLSGTVLYALYHLLPHFELFDLRKRIVHDFGPVSWGIFTTVLFYGVLWIAFLMVLACLAYRRKQLSRGGAYG